MYLSRGNTIAIALTTFLVASTASIQAMDYNSDSYVGVFIDTERSKRVNHDTYVAQVIQDLDNNQLTSLDLSIEDNTRNPITREDTLKIANSLTTNTSLIKLKLRSNILDGDEFITFLGFLESNKTLTNLDYVYKIPVDFGFDIPLCDSEIGQKILKVLQFNHSLITISSDRIDTSIQSILERNKNRINPTIAFQFLNNARSLHQDFINVSIDTKK